MKLALLQTLAWMVSFGMSLAVFRSGQNLLVSKGGKFGFQTESTHQNEVKSSHETLQLLTDEVSKVSTVSDDSTQNVHQEITAQPGEPEGKTQSTAPSSKTEAKHDAEHMPENNQLNSSWNYVKGDAGGPSEWAFLSENFSNCTDGSRQSPIEIKQQNARGRAPKLSFQYGKSKLALQNVGPTIIATALGGDHFILINGQKFELAQFHFHTPSEHNFDGIPAELEIHFVHKNKKNNIAMVAVLVHEIAGLENKTAKPIWDILPRVPNSKAVTSAPFDISKLIPIKDQYIQYEGSLTTPPCTEGVQWFVLRSPITMSSGQIEAYSSMFDGPTNRPTQPLKAHKVFTNSAEVFSH